MSVLSKVVLNNGWRTKIYLELFFLIDSDINAKIV